MFDPNILYFVYHTIMFYPQYNFVHIECGALIYYPGTFISFIQFILTQTVPHTKSWDKFPQKLVAQNFYFFFCTIVKNSFFKAINMFNVFMIGFHLSWGNQMQRHQRYFLLYHGSPNIAEIWSSCASSRSNETPECSCWTRMCPAWHWGVAFPLIINFERTDLSMAQNKHCARKQPCAKKKRFTQPSQIKRDPSHRWSEKTKQRGGCACMWMCGLHLSWWWRYWRTLRIRLSLRCNQEQLFFTVKI